MQFKKIEKVLLIILLMIGILLIMEIKKEGIAKEGGVKEGGVKEGVAKESKKEGKGVELPPPPIPFSQVYEEPIGNQTNIEIITNLYEIPENVLIEFLRKRDRLNPYLRDYKNLKVIPFMRNYLQPTNVFFYSPSVPLLFQFPFKIKRVLFVAPIPIMMVSGGGQGQGQGQVAQGQLQTQGGLVYDEHYLFVLAPDPSTDIFSFVVVSETDQTYYFFGERATSTLTQNKNVILHYLYVFKKELSPLEVLRYYWSRYKVCPVDGEVAEVNGELYLFRIQKGSVLLNEDYVSFCGHIYEVRRYYRGL